MIEKLKDQIQSLINLSNEAYLKGDYEKADKYWLDALKMVDKHRKGE